MTHLFGEYRDHVKENRLDASKQLADLRTYVDVFRRFESYSPASREGAVLRRLQALDTTMVIPVLLEVLRAPKSEEDKARFIQVLESYLVRRAVCGLACKAYNRLFVGLLQHLSQTAFSSEQLQRYLLEREGESGVWPTDDQFRQAFEVFPVYNRLKQARIRMILEAIEQALRNGKSEQVHIDETLAIEHIMPRQWQVNWPLPPGVNGEHEDRRNLLIHTFGNLSLVTRKLNPAMSNGAWADKKSALLEHSVLALNRQLHKHSEWDEGCVLARSREMADHAVKLWQRPSG